MVDNGKSKWTDIENISLKVFKTCHQYCDFSFIKSLLFISLLPFDAGFNEK